MANVRQYRIRSRLFSVGSAMAAFCTSLGRLIAALFSPEKRPGALARLAEKLPMPLVILFSRHILGPAGVARILDHMDPQRIAILSQSFSPEFIARIAMALDPESRSRILKPLPFDVVLAAARPLIDMEAFEVTAEFAAMLPRPHLKQLVVQLNDPVGVAHISGHMPVERSAEVLMAFSPRLGAQVLNEVMHQGYSDNVASVGPLLPAERIEAMTPYLVPRTRNELVSRLDQGDSRH